MKPARRREDVFVRFASHTKFDPDSKCWNWVGGKNAGGYSVFNVGCRTWRTKKTTLAHIFSYEVYKGQIQKGLQIDHLCRNRACVNPNHLEAVTQKENLLRGNGFCAKNARKTHCRRGHLFSSETVKDLWHLNRGYRKCDICAKANRVSRWQKQKYGRDVSIEDCL